MVARERTLSASELTEVQQIRRALRREHEERGTPLRTLAAEIGCSKTQVSNLLNGAQPFPKTLVKLRHWYSERVGEPSYRSDRPISGVAFPTFPNLGLPPDVGQKLLRSGELEALRHFAWHGDEEHPSFASLASGLGVERDDMLRFIDGELPSPTLEAALRRFTPRRTLTPPRYGLLALAVLVDALIECGVTCESAAALRMVIVWAVQEFCSKHGIDGPEWLLSAAWRYGASAASRPEEVVPG
jgi:hypothetical protein